MIRLLSCLNNQFHLPLKLEHEPTPMLFVWRGGRRGRQKRHKVLTNMSWLTSQNKKKYFSFRYCYIPWIVPDFRWCFGNIIYTRRYFGNIIYPKQGIIIRNKNSKKDSINTFVGLPPIPSQAYESVHDPSPTDATIVRNENNVWDVTSKNIYLTILKYHFQHTLRRSVSAGSYFVTRSLPKRETSVWVPYH